MTASSKTVHCVSETERQDLASIGCAVGIFIITWHNPQQPAADRGAERVRCQPCELTRLLARVTVHHFCRAHVLYTRED